MGESGGRVRSGMHKMMLKTRLLFWATEANLNMYTHSEVKFHFPIPEKCQPFKQHSSATWENLEEVHLERSIRKKH